MRRFTFGLTLGALIALQTSFAMAQEEGVEDPDAVDAPAPDDGAVADEGAESGDDVAPEAVDDTPPPPPPPPVEPVEEVAPVEPPVEAVPEAPEAEEEEDSSWPFNLTASLGTRYEAREQYDQIGRADADMVRFRARVGIITDKLDLSDDIAVLMRFVPQATGAWQLAGLSDPALGLHIGALEIFGGPLRLEVGRFEMSYGDELLIGTVNWHPVGRSFDGTRLRWSLGEGGAFADAFFTVTQEGSPVTNFGNGDTYFTGLYAGLGPLLMEGLALDVYSLALVSMASTDPMAGTPLDPSGRVTLGARYKQKFGMIDARAEAGIQVGSQTSNQSIMAYQADGELGLSLFGGGFRLSVEGFIASGNDPDDAGTNGAWNHLFPTAHKWLGFADIIGFGGGVNGRGRSNVAGGVLHLTGKLFQGFGLYAHGHIFSRLQDVLITDAMGMTTRTTAGMAGAELDIGAKWTIAPGLNSRIGYALFMPNENYYGTSTPAHFLEIELHFTY